ncbi:MAG: hypothetical protein Q7R79_00365 [bacterium]|nr:hypothetical protein [bacterium]
MKQKTHFMMVSVLILFFGLSLVSATSAQECNPNIPEYSQPGCISAPQQPIAPYSPPPFTIPSTPLYSPLIEGPSWNQPVEDTKDGTNDIITKIDSEKLLTYVQGTLQDIAKINTKVAKQGKSLAYFYINNKQLKSKLKKLRSDFLTIEKLIEDEKEEEAEPLLVKVDYFVSDTFIEVLDGVERAYNTVKRLPNTEVRNLLRRTFQPVSKLIMNGDSDAAEERVGLYLKDLKNNEKLYATKRLTSKNRKVVQKNVKTLNKTLKGEVSKDTEIIKESEKIEVKSPSQVNTKKIGDDVKRINDAIQRSIQSDAMMKAYNLGSGIR